MSSFAFSKSILNQTIRLNSIISYLVTSRTPRLDGLSMMPAAIELPLLVEVDEIDKELVADAADEASWMPKAVGAAAGRGDADVAAVDRHRALKKYIYTVLHIRNGIGM